MWFRKTPPPRVVMSGGLAVGQLVQHRVSGGKAVIVGFGDDDDGPYADVTRGDFGDDELRCRLAELEPYAPPLAVNAVREEPR